MEDTNHTVAVSNIATLSPHTFNETRGQFTYDSLNAPSNDDLGPTVTISGVATLGRFSSSPTSRLNYLFEAVDNLVMQRGAHTVKTGVDLLYNCDTITFPQSLRGAYTFSSLNTFLSGAYNTQGFTQTFGTPSVTQGNPNLGVYLQDEWKVNRRLTVNAGVRYDLQFLQTINTDTNNVSPRIGFAWSPLDPRVPSSAEASASSMTASPFAPWPTPCSPPPTPPTCPKHLSSATSSVRPTEALQPSPTPLPLPPPSEPSSTTP